MCGCGSRHKNNPYVPKYNYGHVVDGGPTNLYYHRVSTICTDDVKCRFDPCKSSFIDHPVQSAYYWRPPIDISDIPHSRPKHLRKADLDLAYDNCEKYYQKVTKVYNAYEC